MSSNNPNISSTFDSANAEQLVTRSVSASRRSLARIACGMLFFLVLCSPWLVQLSIEFQLKIIVLPIALLGVLHGGADPWVARALLNNWAPLSRRFTTYSMYLGLMVLVLICWSIQPAITLAGFLTISLWHFGRQDIQTFGMPDWHLPVLIYGSLPILGPMLGHTEQTAVLFGWLAMESSSDIQALLIQLNPLLLTLWFIGLGMLLLRLATEGQFAALRVLTRTVPLLFAAMYLLPPLIAFAAYFCALHSFGHLIEMAESRHGPWKVWTLKQWMMRLWPATGGAFALGLIFWVVLASTSTPEMMYRENLVRVLFWGLAALTVPHILLHALWHRTRTK